MMTATSDCGLRVADLVFGMLSLGVRRIGVSTRGGSDWVHWSQLTSPHAGTRSPPPPVLTSFTLIQRVSALAVEVAQVFSLDEVKAPGSNSAE